MINIPTRDQIAVAMLAKVASRRDRRRRTSESIGARAAVAAAVAAEKRYLRVKENARRIAWTENAKGKESLAGKKSGLSGRLRTWIFHRVTRLLPPKLKRRVLTIHCHKDLSFLLQVNKFSS